jgi:hypothetical protein
MKIRTLLGELIVSPKAVNAHRGESAGGRLDLIASHLGLMTSTWPWPAAWGATTTSGTTRSFSGCAVR